MDFTKLMKATEGVAGQFSQNLAPIGGQIAATTQNLLRSPGGQAATNVAQGIGGTMQQFSERHPVASAVLATQARLTVKGMIARKHPRMRALVDTAELAEGIAKAHRQQQQTR